MSERAWVWDQQALDVVEVEITSMEQPNDPMTRGLVRVGHLGIGDRARLPSSRREAVEEGRRWLSERIDALNVAMARLDRSEPS